MMVFAKLRRSANAIAAAFLLLGPPASGEDEIAIAMAGGSFRAASACYGTLRGFSQKKIPDPNNLGEEVSAMDLVAYNSAISGGSIPAMLYAFARVPTQELLETNRTIDPSKITKEELDRMPKTSMGYVIARKPYGLKLTIGFLARKILNPLNLFNINRFWTAGVHEKIFLPLNVPNNKYFTSSQEELENILRDNPELNENDFLIPREDVKTGTMILVSMHGSRFDRNQYMKNYLAIRDDAWGEYAAQTNSTGKRPNMTDIVLSIRDKYGGNLPMPYVFSLDSVQNKYSGNVRVWDKLIQFPEKSVRPFEWGSKKGEYGRKCRFSVETLTSMSTNFVGSSGKAPAQFLTNLRTIPLSDGSEATQMFADGGTNDLMGILPLVARGTKNIISVYNFNQNPNITVFSDSYAGIYKNTSATSMGDSEFDKQFQVWIKHINPRVTALFGFFNEFKIPQANIMNHVFYDPNMDRLKELMIKYNSLFEAGEPLIATLHDLEVIDNPFWGVTGGNKINLTLMYFNMPKKFSEKVPEDAVSSARLSKIDADGQFTNEEFKVVPELDVDGLNQIQYSNAQVNMMGYLGSWMVNHSWDGLKGQDGEILFEGFGEIFSKKR